MNNAERKEALKVMALTIANHSKCDPGACFDAENFHSPAFTTYERDATSAMAGLEQFMNDNEMVFYKP